MKFTEKFSHFIIVYIYYDRHVLDELAGLEKQIFMVSNQDLDLSQFDLFFVSKRIFTGVTSVLIKLSQVFS
jgi:hypothetical protein